MAMHCLHSLLSWCGITWVFCKWFSLAFEKYLTLLELAFSISYLKHLEKYLIMLNWVFLLACYSFFKNLEHLIKVCAGLLSSHFFHLELTKCWLIDVIIPSVYLFAITFWAIEYWAYSWLYEWGGEDKNRGGTDEACPPIFIEVDPRPKHTTPRPGCILVKLVQCRSCILAELRFKVHTAYY